MAILAVRLYGDPVLRRRAAPVPEATPEIQKLIADMVDTMYHQAGIGLAAPQVGVGLRLFVLDDGDGVARTYLDPVIVEQAGEDVAEEGCLSLPGIFADVRRAQRVAVEARDATGAPFRRQASGLLSRAFQHEIDHLDGILFLDRLDKIAQDRIKRRIKREGFPEDVAAGALAL